jgi:hypothetical protein
MSSTPRPRYAYPDLGLSLLLLVNLALLLYYIGVDYQVTLNADSAVKNLLAQEIVETGSYFPPDWNYVNGDLWVFYTHTLIVPLLGFFPNSFALHAVAGLISAILIFHATWLLGAVLGMTRRARLASLVLLSGGISAFMAENLFGQVSYGTMYYLACYSLYFSWRLLDAGHGARWLWGGAVALVLVLVFWANPQRALVLYGAPLMAGAIALWLPELKAARAGAARLRWPLPALLGVVAASAVAGVLLHYHVMHDQRAAPQWLSFGGMLTNAAGTVQGLLSLLGALPAEKQPVAGLSGLYAALRLLSGLAVLVLCVAVLRKAIDPRHRARLLVGTFALVSLGANLFLILTTNVANMADPESSVRYLVPPVLFLLVLLVGAVVDGHALRAPARLAGTAALLVLACSALSALHQPYSPGYFTPSGAARQNTHWRLAEYLGAQGLHYGYASYWNAAPITVFSAQNVRVRQIELSQGKPLPMRQLSSDRWYWPSAWQGQTFLLLSTEEAKGVDWPALTRVLGQPVRQLDFEYWKIAVFADNIAGKLPGWGFDLGAPMQLPIGANSMHMIGRLAGTPAALVAEPGEAGVLHFGPYIVLKPGRYRASFALASSGPPAGDLGMLDVAARHGTKIYAQARIGPGAATAQLAFTVTEQETDVEFRVVPNGAGQVRLLGIGLARDKQP